MQGAIPAQQADVREAPGAHQHDIRNAVKVAVGSM